MIKVIEAEQRSEAWFTARAGLLTGSRASDAFAKLKSGGEAASRRDYKLQLAVELLGILGLHRADLPVVEDPGVVQLLTKLRADARQLG